MLETSQAFVRPRDWPRAWKALGRLIEDPQRTAEVFEILEALAGPAFEKDFQRFAADPRGRDLLRERPSLLAALSDRDSLRSLPAGSLGRAYLEFMETGELTADGLVAADMEATERRPEPLPRDPDREFLGDRLRDQHDLWHVLTGYGMDEAGEAANLAFTLAQLPSLGLGLIVIAGAVVGPKDWRLTWPRYLVTAWQRGRRASYIVVEPWEDLLSLPLAEVRARLRIEAPEVAHPEGVIVANRGTVGSDGSRVGSSWNEDWNAARPA